MRRASPWREIKRAPLLGMPGRVGKSQGNYMAVVWLDGSWWRWQIYHRETGRANGGGMEGTELGAKRMAGKMLAEVAR